MRTDTHQQRDWSGSLEQLEDRLVMSADPLGGLLGGEIQQHAIVDDLPPIEHQVVAEQPPLLVQHGSAEVPPALSQPLQSEADFWIDSGNLRAIDEELGRIEQSLAAAHDQSGLTQVRTDYGFDGTGQTVAVIDSGIAYDHLALGGGLGSGYRVVGGWDFTGENDADPYDDGPSGGHGTHVAGIIGGDAGSDNGVAPGVDLVALRVFDDAGNGYFSWVENALQWVYDNRDSFENPITAVNLSLGVATWNSDAIPSWANLENEFAQLETAGIFISVSAGNSYTSFNTTGLSYPAASPYVIPVASVDDGGLLSYFSQRNARVIAAPGRGIVSTVPDYAGNNNGIADDYASFSGTSMAAPYVAGASVLIREAMEFVGYTNITQDMIYDHMIATADSFFDSATNANYSRLNLEAAIDALIPTDDFGSTLATAYNLGTVSTSTSTSGLIGTLDDQDFFSFTAGATGTVSFSATANYGLTPSYSVDGATGSVANNTLTFDVIAGDVYTVSLETAAGQGIGYYDMVLSLESSVIPVAAVIVKTMTNSDGVVYTLDSENWLSVDGNRTWSDTYDFSLANNQSVYKLGTNGDLDRLLPQETWTNLDTNVTKFAISDAGIAYSLDSNNVLSINGISTWSKTDDFLISADQTIFWQSTNGGLYHRLANGTWVVVDSDATNFAVRDNGTVYSLGTDNWLNINGTAVWSKTFDFSLTEDQSLNWYGTNGGLYQLSSGNSWQFFGSNVEKTAVSHDGVTYSLTAAGGVSMDGVLTWSNVSDIYTDAEGYLVLESTSSTDTRVAGRFLLSSKVTTQSSAIVEQVNQTANQTTEEEVSSDSYEGQTVLAQRLGMARGNRVNGAANTARSDSYRANASVMRFKESSSLLGSSTNNEFLQSVDKRVAFEAWEETLLGGRTQRDRSVEDLAFAENIENILADTDAKDSWYTTIGI